MLYLSSMMLCLAALVQTAHAVSPLCTVEYATDLVQVDDIQRRGHAAKATIPLLNELNVINSRAKDPHRPVGDQLAPRDAARFAELAQQNKLIRLSAFVESAHARDADVVQRMEAAAWKNYADPAYSPSADDIPAMTLGAMRTMLPAAEKWETSTAPGCSVDAAKQASPSRRTDGNGVSSLVFAG